MAAHTHRAARAEDTVARLIELRAPRARVPIFWVLETVSAPDTRLTRTKYHLPTDLSPRAPPSPSAHRSTTAAPPPPQPFPSPLYRPLPSLASTAAGSRSLCVSPRS
ncbi:hypothetical protein BD410DRAFT_845332 [Rickenella mellea]|uniref:Uncharacterized protein n=1 Tax=Rickenella mellea TaxID=50990 RepID=A0A4Y7PJX0_9AGAM|nr:hypothetical protein BD410DRAFT_845332 [Rickenella mellea]